MGQSDMLQKVAEACATVADLVRDVKDNTPYTLKRITLPKGIPSFRFNQVVKVDGEEYEVMVRKV